MGEKNRTRFSVIVRTPELAILRVCSIGAATCARMLVL
jgi:hypothetical protein